MVWKNNIFIKKWSDDNLISQQLRDFLNNNAIEDFKIVMITDTKIEIIYLEKK